MEDAVAARAALAAREKQWEEDRAVHLMIISVVRMDSDSSST